MAGYTVVWGSCCWPSKQTRPSGEIASRPDSSAKSALMSNKDIPSLSPIHPPLTRWAPNGSSSGTAQQKLGAHTCQTACEPPHCPNRTHGNIYSALDYHGGIISGTSSGGLGSTLLLQSEYAYLASKTCHVRGTSRSWESAPQRARRPCSNLFA